MEQSLLFVHDALNNFLLLFADALVLMLGWLAKHWAEQIGQRVKNERTRGILQRAELLAMAVVKRVFQMYVKPAKEAGKWGPAQETEAKRLAMQELRASLGRQGLLDLAWVLYGEGIPPAGIEVGTLSTLLEAAVHDAKHQGKALAASYAPLPEAPAPAMQGGLFGPIRLARDTEVPGPLAPQPQPV